MIVFLKTRKRNFCKISLCAVPFLIVVCNHEGTWGEHEEKMCEVNFYRGRKKWGNIQKKGQFLKCCAKGGPLPAPFPSDGSSMPIRWYTVYVYIERETERFLLWLKRYWPSNDKIGNFLDSVLLVLVIIVVVIVVAVITAKQTIIFLSSRIPGQIPQIAQISGQSCVESSELSTLTPIVSLHYIVIFAGYSVCFKIVT